LHARAAVDASRAGALLDAGARACDRDGVKRWLFAPLALTAVLSACAARPPNLAALPAPAPACPADGCGAPAPSSLAAEEHAGDCSLPGVEPCGGAPASECMARALAAWDELRGDARGDRGLPCIARLLSDACARGEPQACVFAGRLWLDGRGVPADPSRGLAMLAEGCDAGLALSCAVALRWLGEPSHKSDAEDLGDLHARLESENGCWMGQADLCLQVGRLYRIGGEGVSPDLAQSARVFAHGCDLGERMSCNSLGVALNYGDGVARDLEQAVALYDRACRLGLPLGCANLGYMLEHGAGIARDEGRARGLYRDACVAGESYGCRHVDLLAAETHAVPRDGAPALQYWQRRCDGARDARACAFVSLLYLDGPDGFERDEAKSAQALALACRLGYARACEWVRESQDE
jgi:TPR repeat protein